MKKHLRSHMKACRYCYHLFNLNELIIHESQCSMNLKESPTCTLQISQTVKQDLNPIIKKLKTKQQNLETVKTLNSEDLKILTTDINKLMIENKQQEILQPLILEQLKPWQQSILDIMKPSNFNNRKIYVLYDQVGGIGKTTFKKYVNNFPEFITISGAQTSNLYPGYQKLLKNLTQEFWNIIVDLPRSTQFLPSYIEQLKDNTYPSYNYYATPLTIANNNIFIFLNNLNLLKTLSLDRIITYIVEDNQLIEKKIILHKNEIKLSTGTELLPIFSHKRKNFCKELQCLPDCEICKNFMCHKCFKCKECNNCVCKYNCEICNQVFSTKFNLNRHKQRNHVITTVPKINANFINSTTITNNNTYINICPLCNKQCKNIICDECKNQTFSNDFTKIECKYCHIMILPYEMHDHIFIFHFEHVTGYLYQVDLCM